MIFYYGVTQQGTYHIEHDIVCQDAHYCKVVNEHYAVAAVADGLGSEKYSDLASKIASEKSVLYCIENIKETDDEDAILDVVKKSFAVALEEIYKAADAAKQERDQYDTTLALVVYLNQNIYFGNSGDSGIVVLNKNGTYEAITEQQRDENNYVFPLCFGEEKWVFGKKTEVASVLLATDGLFETLFPFLLQNEQVKIYVSLAHYLMNEECLNFQKEGAEVVQKKMDAFVSNISGKQVNDDKTLLVLLDTSVVAERMPEEYYSTPDWSALKRKHDEAFRRAAYPHLYKDEGKNATDGEKSDLNVLEKKEQQDAPTNGEGNQTVVAEDVTEDNSDTKDDTDNSKNGPQEKPELNSGTMSNETGKTNELANDIQTESEQKRDFANAKEASFFSKMKSKVASVLKRKNKNEVE